MLQLIKFAGRQVPIRSAGDALQLNRTEPDSLEAKRWIADLFHHPPDDPITAFVNHEPQNGSVRFITNRPHAVRTNHFPVDRHTALREILEYGSGRISIQQDLVLLFQFEPRMRDAIREFAIVGQ